MRRYLLVLVTIAVVLSLALVGCVGAPAGGGDQGGTTPQPTPTTEPLLKPLSGSKYFCGEEVKLDWSNWFDSLNFSPQAVKLYMAHALDCATPARNNFGVKLQSEQKPLPKTYSFKPDKCGMYFWYVYACDQTHEATSPIMMFCVFPKILIEFKDEEEDTVYASITIAKIQQTFSLTIEPGELRPDTIITITATGCSQTCEACGWWKVDLISDFGTVEPATGTLSGSTVWSLGEATNCLSPQASVATLCSSKLGEKVMTINIYLFPREDVCKVGCCEENFTVNVRLGGEISLGLVGGDCCGCDECLCGYLYVQTPKGIEPPTELCKDGIRIEDPTCDEEKYYTIKSGETLIWSKPVAVIGSNDERYYLCLNGYAPEDSGAMWRVKANCQYKVVMKAGTLFFTNNYGVYFGFPCVDWDGSSPQKGLITAKCFGCP